MLRVVIGVFLILHGLVHLLYFALSRKLFELEPPLQGWPERSWVFSNLLADATTRSLASLLYLVAMLIFVVSGLAFLFQAEWWTPLAVSASLLSSAVIFLFWDGTLQRLPDKGFIGILINIVVIVGVLLIDRAVIVL